MKTLKEILTKSTPPEEWIHDFVHSDNPRFAGKSMAKRRQMALAAYYAKQKSEGAYPSQNSTAEVDMNEAWSKTGKKGKHNETGEDSEEYQKVDKEGKPTGERKWVTKSGKSVNEDQYTAEYKIKQYVDPITGETKRRKVRPHRIEFKNSKMRGEPAMQHNPDDYGQYKEDVQESRAHKVLATFFKNREDAQKAANQTPEQKAEHEKKHHEAMVKAHNEYVKKNPNSIFKPMKEDMENLDEISKHKLVQYIDKATQDVHNKALEAGKQSDKPAKASEFIKKYQQSGKRQAGITKAAVKLAKEEVELVEDMDTAHIHQLLADKDINAKVKDGKVHVHSSDVKAAKMHLGAAGHKHEVVGGLNEDQEEDDRRGAEHHQQELERQEKEKNDLDTKLKKWKNQQRAAKAMKEEVEQIDEISKETLGSYSKKAQADKVDSVKRYNASDRDEEGNKVKDSDLSPARKAIDKMLSKRVDKRAAGLKTAAAKLNKEEVELDEGKVYDPITKKMVARKPIKVQAGGGATRNGVPVETGPSKYKQSLKKEEVEQIDELSKGTLQSYRDKAAKDVGRAYAIHKDPWKKTDKDDMHKLSNRVKGDERAEVKLKEEQIDELSKKTLASYATKAHHDAGIQANDLGHQLGRSTDHTHIFTPGYQKQKGEYLKRSKGIVTAIKKLSKEEIETEAVDYKGIGTDVVDKKKVLNPPVPLTQKPKQVKDFKENDEYDEKWKGYKGKSFKKESSMLKFGDFLNEAKKCTEAEVGAGSAKMQETLVGKQHKLDKNKNGKLDADDFKKLRNEGKKCMDEDDMDESGLRMAAHAAHKDGKKEFQFKGKTYPVQVQKEETELEEGKNGLWANIHAKRKRIAAGSGERMRKPGSKGAPTDQALKDAQEEVQIDELSKGTLGSYVKKAAHDIEYKSGENKELELTEPDDDDERERHDRQRRDVENRHKGIKTAVKKLTKEDTEQIDELSKSTLASYIPKAAKSSRIHGQISTEYRKASERKKNPGLKNALTSLSDKYKKKAWDREDNIKKAANKLAKEEVIDEAKEKKLLDKPISSNQAMKDHEKYFDKRVKLDPKTGYPVKEEVEQEMSPYVKGALAVMDEGKIDDLRDAERLRKAGASTYDHEKKDDNHPGISIHKGTAYGGENQKDDETDEKPETTEKKGRGRPAGSKSGAR